MQRARFRAPTVIVLTCIYFGAAGISQLSMSVPTLRLDGSGLSAYPVAVLSLQDDGHIKNVFVSMLAGAGSSWILRALIFSMLLLICTFGVYLSGYIFLQYRNRSISGKLVRHRSSTPRISSSKAGMYTRM